MITPTEELKDVLRELDGGELANLEPAVKSLDAARRVRRYIDLRIAAIRARKFGRISDAEQAEHDSELILKILPSEWQW